MERRKFLQRIGLSVIVGPAVLKKISEVGAGGDPVTKIGDGVTKVVPKTTGGVIPHLAELGMNEQDFDALRLWDVVAFPASDDVALYVVTDHPEKDRYILTPMEASRDEILLHRGMDFYRVGASFMEGHLS